jgi:D-alanyl-D-alanine carboxypeptidase
MKKLYSLLLVFAAAAAAAPAGIKLQTASPSGDAELYRLSKAVEAKLGELHKAAEFPGVTVGFALPDGRSASVSAGLADLERKTPLAPKDRMLAGSIGKTFAAAVTLQLVAEGRLNLDDPLEKWFGREPWFARLPNARDITLRMLMNHTSGIPEHVLDEKFIEALRANPDRVWRPEELIAYVFDKKPLFAAGKGWSYADTNYILVGMVFERVSGKKLYSEVARRILKPLALSDTIPSDRRALPGVITGYSRPDSPFKFTGRVIVDGKFVANPQMEWTGGGFASTAGDLARWAKALYEGRVLGKRELEQMLAGVDATGGRGAGGSYGLAVQIRNSDWGRSYGHGGWFPGYLSEMEYFPEKRIAVAIQFNTDNVRQLKRGPRAYIAEVMRIILGEAAMKKAA